VRCKARTSGGEAGALRQEVGHVLGREGLVGKGILHGPRHGFRGVDVAQGDDFPHVRLRIEAPLFERDIVLLGLWGQCQKPQEELMRASLVAVLQERRRVSGVFNVLEPIVAPRVTGNASVTVVDTEPIRIGFEGERLASILSWHEVAVRV